MVRAAMIGIGKMGISHYAILGAHPKVKMVAVCDSVAYLTAIMHKYTGVEAFKDYRKMIDAAGLDCVIVATPTATHLDAARLAISRGLHVFVEKPLCIDPAESRELAELAGAKGVVNQVGYHNRFIGTFREARRLVRAGAIGEVYHVDGSAFGQVVTRQKAGSTWRAKKSEGGGCLHDYASHVVDLMNFLVGPPSAVVGARMRSVYSRDVEDAVYAVFEYPDGASGMLETNWSDETHRKMSTSVELYGTKGKISVDRQECKVYLKKDCAFEGYPEGWTVRYITGLQEPVDFYLRGEEYSAQIDSFVNAIEKGRNDGPNTFETAYETDRVIDMIQKASGK